MSFNTLNEPEPAGLPALDRRGLMAGVAAASGFALAVQPVSAQTITTDAAGLTAGMVEVNAPDGKVPAFRAYPEGKPAAPVVLVVSEIFGVHEHIKDVARRLAKLGYYAIAVEHFIRHGDVRTAPDMAGVQAIVGKQVDASVMRDLDAAVAFAKSEGALADRLAITGFCWGGRITWLYAAHNPALKAGVAWYGRVTGPTDAIRPKHPQDVAAQIKAPVLGLYGGQDQGIPVAGVEKLVADMKAAGGRAELIVYPDAPHAFHADYRPSYREAAAKDGWARLQAWLKTHGV
ncbi:MAG: dienelactone hydrolase family protein [Methylobacteriaceae bacterium]|nr:dienelactone hydrolase family protein [Methylobacteriaceae bacterium]